MNQSINQIIMQYGGNLYCHTPTLCQRSSRLIKYFVVFSISQDLAISNTVHAFVALFIMTHMHASKT